MSTTRQSHGSSTAVIELEPVHVPQDTTRSSKPTSGQFSRVLGRHATDGTQDEDRNESLPSPTTASEEVIEKWDSSNMNMARTFSAFWGFVIMGMNDATYGVR